MWPGDCRDRLHLPRLRGGQAFALILGNICLGVTQFVDVHPVDSLSACLVICADQMISCHCMNGGYCLHVFPLLRLLSI